MKIEIKDVKDVENVYGIGKKTREKIKELLDIGKISRV